MPGNSSIEVAIRRRFVSGSGNYWSDFSFGNWQLDIPRIESDFIANYGDWANGNECSGDLNPYKASWGGVLIDEWAYWNGVSLHVPGKTQDKVLNNSGKIISSLSHPLITKSNWRISCIDRKNAQGVKIGEGFVAQSPDGLTYTFSQPRNVRRSPLSVSPNAPYYKSLMLVTKVENRFGHSATYNYDSEGKLISIVASDDRTITLKYRSMTYGASVISSVTANNRTWSYQYSGGYGGRSLNKVTRPDTKQWTYNLANFNKETYQDVDLNTNCLVSNIDDNLSRTGTVAHPNGVIGTFVVKATIHGRSNVLAYSGFKHLYSRCNVSFSLQSKTLSGPNLSALNWQYSYSQNKGSYTTGGASSETTPDGLTGSLPSNITNSGDYKTTTVIAPDTSKSVHYFNRDFSSYYEGKEFALDYFEINSGSLLQRIERSYIYGTVIGHSELVRENVKPIHYQTLLSETKTTRYNGNSSEYYKTQYSNFNLYGVPEKKYEFNEFNNNKRYTKQDYTHDLTNYLLNLPTKTYVSPDDGYVSSELISEQTYHSATSSYKSLPNYRYRFGRWVQRNESYHTSGTDKGLPKLTRLNATNRWSEASNYYRGKPLTIRTPQSDSTSSQYAYRTVDKNGWVTSTTDFKGTPTSYGYDGLGRITLINPSNNFWNNTTITYTTATGSEESAYVSSGMLIKTTTTGNLESKIYFDGLLRPVLTKVRDTSDSSSIRYTRTAYDSYGRAVFQSQPSSTISTTYGNSLTYDGLGRITKSVNNALGGSGVRYSYAPDSKVSVTDNRNLLTTITYKAYGSPSKQQPISIITPSNLSNTSMTYSLYGNLGSITQGGITEYRVYDSYHNLCKTVRPDTGNTAMVIDAVGNTSWLAQGSSVSGSTSACDTSVYANEKTTYSYDNLGALKSVVFGDSTPDKTYGYDKNGNLTILSFDGSVHNYGYNDLNLLTRESLAVDGYTWLMTHQYDANGNISNTVYPSSTNINYSPNALGQAQAVGSYASNIDYFSNGQLKNMTQGNNCLNTQILKTYGAPDVQRTLCNGSNIVYNQYSYDNNLNISYWDDLQNNAYDLKFTYDALDRLDNIKDRYSSVIGDMNYDAMGNITKFNFDGGQVNYYYDSTKKLSSTTGAVSYSMSYDNRGNVTSNGSKSFSYNLANQMTIGDGNSYTYDGHDRRVKAIDGQGTHYSFYSLSGQLVFERINGVNRDNYYLGSQLVAYKQGSTTTYIHADLMGSTAATTNSSGNVLTRSRYKPFGTEWGAAKNEIGYTGHKFDTDLGLSYMQARYYDPVIGRFYSNDPIGFRDVHSFNRYAYANNNPYKYVDPTGMASKKKGSDFCGVTGCDYSYSSGDSTKDDEKDGTNNSSSALNNYVENSIDGLTSISLGEVWDKISGLNPAVGGSLAGLKYLAILPKLSGQLRIVNGVIHSPSGFKMNLGYYDKLWRQGRPAPFIQAAQIMKSNPIVSPDPRGVTGFNKYVANGLEMIMNPQTKEIWHIQPIRVKK